MDIDFLLKTTTTRSLGSLIIDITHIFINLSQFSWSENEDKNHKKCQVLPKSLRKLYSLLELGCNVVYGANHRV